jgi:hypothetical protein
MRVTGVTQTLSGSSCAAGAVTLTPTWVASHICVIARARRCYLIYGERNWRMAVAKMLALGQLEARYRQMRRVLRVSTAASLSRLILSVSTWAVASALQDGISALVYKPNDVNELCEMAQHLMPDSDGA